MNNITYREATVDDLTDIVRMLADDFLGQQRERFEDSLQEGYGKAFREIENDPNNELIVAVLRSHPYEGGVDAALSGRSGSLSDTDATNASETLALPSKIVGTMQLTFTPSISFQGGKRCTVESVRIDEKYRGKGIGREMMLWAIERAKERGCVSMQLTTNNERADAHRFYENLGFSSSHLGMKLRLK